MDPSQQSSLVGKGRSASAPSPVDLPENDHSQPVGKGRRGETVTSAMPSNQLPDKPESTIHDDKKPGGTLSTAQPSVWKGTVLDNIWSWWSEKKVETTEATSQFPEPDTASTLSDTDIEDRSIEETDVTADSLTGKKEDGFQWEGTLGGSLWRWYFGKKKVEKTESTVSQNPPMPSEESTEEINEGPVQPESATTETPPVTQDKPEIKTRKVSETVATPKVQQSWWSYLFGETKVKPVEGQGYIPQADREIEKEDGVLWSAAKATASKAVGLVSQVFSGGKTEEAAGEWGSWGVKKLLETRGRTTLPGLNDQQFKTLLGELTRLISDTIADSPTAKEIYIPEISIDVGQSTPVRIRQLKFKAKPAELRENCALIHKQKLRRSIEVHDLECYVDIPRPDQGPAELQIKMDYGIATIGSNLGHVLGGINPTDVFQMAKHVASNYSSSGFTQSAKEGLAQAPLGPDNTAVQIQTPKLSIRFDKLNSASSFIPDQIVPLDKPGVLAFNNGEVVLTDLVLARPLSLSKAGSQSTILQCGGFSLENKRTRKCLVDLQHLDVSGIDESLNGHAEARLALDLGKIKYFPNAPKQVKYLQGIKLDCQIKLDIEEGEVDLAQIKEGLTVTPRKGFRSWLGATVINAVLRSPKTRIYTDRHGSKKLDIAFSIPVLGLLVSKIFKSRLTGISLPAAVTMIKRQEGSDGRVIASDIISMLVTNILNVWFLAPEKVHLVRRDHEVFCNEAAAGSLSASRAVLLTAMEMERSGHHNESLRLLQAVPYDHYGIIAAENELIPVEDLNRMAHRLITVDPDKAIAIYGRTLNRTPEETRPKEYNAEYLLKKARLLKDGDPGAQKAAMDIFEFLALANPDSGAFEQLSEMSVKGIFPADRMGPLFMKIIMLPPYAGVPALQVTKLVELAPHMGSHTSEILCQFPTQQIEESCLKKALEGTRLLSSLEPVMISHGQSAQMAKIWLRVDDEQRAGKLLDNAIKTGDSSSLTMRVDEEIKHGHFGKPRYITAHKLLNGVILSDHASPEFRKEAAKQLVVLWENTRGQSINWPHNEPLADTSPLSQLIQIVLQSTFNIQTPAFIDKAKLHEILTLLHEDYEKAVIEVGADNPSYPIVDSYRHMLAEMVSDADDGQEFQQLIDFEYAPFQQSEVAEMSPPSSPIPSEPTANIRKNKGWSALVIRSVGKAWHEGGHLFKGRTSTPPESPDLLDFTSRLGGVEE